MITGYTRPLYLLPFDHRASYISGLFGWKEPLNVEQMVIVANSKHVIYEGFQRAIADRVPKDRVGILIDEEFGSAILRDAVSKGYITVASVEKSDQMGHPFVQLLVVAFTPFTLFPEKQCFEERKNISSSN